MTGFRLSAEAVEAGATASYETFHRRLEAAVDRKLSWPPFERTDDVTRRNQRADFEAGLAAALPVLAESPDVVQRCADLLAADPDADYYLQAQGLLRDLFAAAPTDTTEENTDG